MKKRIVRLFTMLCVLTLFVAFMAIPASATAAGNVSGAIEGTWNAAKGQVQTIVNNVVFPVIDILSYMSNRLIGIGNSVASIDELYLFLTNQTAIEYIRNSMKRVRKKDSCVVLASQNIEDFLIPSIREFTKPMFSIPTHQFLFYPGSINPRDYMDALQVDEAEYDLIRNPDRGVCLYRCGGERYYLQVQVPDYKEALFGKAGGR